MSNNTILVIDDDKDIRESLIEVLVLEGYKVLEAENGQLGLDLLLNLQSSELPGLIFLDLRMPIMDGLGFLKQRLNHNSLIDIPVVIATANTNNADSLAAKSFAKDYLKKPLDLSQLYEIVERYCVKV